MSKIESKVISTFEVRFGRYSAVYSVGLRPNR